MSSALSIPPLAAIDRERVKRGGLRKFYELAFPLVEPRPFEANWHIDAMCEHLEAVSKRQIRNLIINVPPGTGKSIGVSVMWPVWTWLPENDPSFKFIYASYSANLMRRDALRARNLINSKWFQDRWGFQVDPSTEKPLLDRPLVDNPVCIPFQNTRAALSYENNHKGFRFSTSIGGEVTGRHANGLVVDDPNKAQAAMGGRAATGVELQESVDFWSGAMPSRQADPKTTVKVIIMQRLHEADLAGVMEATGDYEVLKLPMTFRESRGRCRTSIGFVDPRAEGELLCPGRFGPEEVRTLERAMGPTTAAAQLDQDPIPQGGAIFKSEWLMNVWDKVPAGAVWAMSVDATFKAEANSDFVVIQVWAKHAGKLYLVHQVRERLSFSATVQKIKDVKSAFPKVTKIYIEDKANGSAIIDTLGKKLSGIEAVEPEGGKVARAQAVECHFADGNVLLPPEEQAPWIGAYREELTKFPRGANDDQVDATTQALVQMAGSSGDRMKAAMDAIKARR